MDHQSKHALRSCVSFLWCVRVYARTPTLKGVVSPENPLLTYQELGCQYAPSVQTYRRKDQSAPSQAV